MYKYKYVHFPIKSQLLIQSLKDLCIDVLYISFVYLL